MKSTEQKILSIAPYVCGRYTLSSQYVGGREKLILPQLVFRIEHRKYGNILFNSGFSHFARKTNIKIFLLCRKNGISFSDFNEISSQLLDEGMDEMCIKHIILSHTAADTVSGLRLFSNCTLTSTAQALAQMDNSLFAEYIPKRIIPPKTIPRRAASIYKSKSICTSYFKYIYDIFGDGSILGISLSGCAKGHIGLFIPERNLLLGGYACIDSTLLGADPTEYFLKHQYDSEQYLDTLARLRHFIKENPRVRCVFSRDKLEYARTQIYDIQTG